MADEGAAPRVRIDYESGERVYLQIVRIIRDMIISGELPVGAQVPSGTQMRREWGVNRLTGAMAVEELRKAGLVVTRPGVGTFVAATPSKQVIALNPGDQVISRMPTEFSSARSKERICALSSTISALRVSKPAPVITVSGLSRAFFIPCGTAAVGRV